MNMNQNISINSNLITSFGEIKVVRGCRFGYCGSKYLGIFESADFVVLCRSDGNVP